MNLKHTVQKNNGHFSFNDKHEVVIRENYKNKTREPWLMLLARREQKPTDTLCWGLTSNGTAFARIGTQEGDLINGFVHEDPYKTTSLGPYAYIVCEDGTYFTNTWYPTLHKDQELETTFGFGYVKYKTAYNGLTVETTCFIPDGFDAMVQIIRIKNNTAQKRKIKLFTVNPVNIGDARDIQFSGFNSLMLGGGCIDKQINSIVWRASYGIPFSDDKEAIKGMFGKVAVHTTSCENSQFSTKYSHFVGHHTNTMAHPEALSLDFLPCKDAEELTSALSVIRNEITIEAGEEKNTVVSLLAASTEDYYLHDKKELLSHLVQVKNPKTAWELYNQTVSGWKKELDKLQIDVTGEKELMPSFRWLQYQCAMVVLLNRMKSRFHSGFEYGYGFRDILQDLLAMLPYEPKKAADLIVFTASQMFTDGTVYHNFFVSARGNKDFKACDDPLWLIYAVCEYIKETGDTEFLNKTVPYADAKEGGPAASGTILDHLKTALNRVWSMSDNGLPFMQDADWNDDLSSLENHMSVMAAQMLFKAQNDMIELLNYLGIEEELVKTYQNRSAIIKENIETRAIDVDGKYIRAISPDPDTIPHLGTKNGDGYTFFEPIAWAGFSEIASKERFALLMDVCEKELYDLYGITICQGDRTMAENKLPRDYSAWKRNAPGKKENGGEFRHLESWYIASLCKYGYGRKARDLYINTLPAVASTHDPYNYAAEPFVFPEYVSGPSSNEHGRAGHTWLTGTAPTRLGVLIDYIFGLQRTYGGLKIDPAVSEEWQDFKAHRIFRETSFSITYKNENRIQKGVSSLIVDGTKVEGNVIPEKYYDRKEHSVEVIMGNN